MPFTYIIECGTSGCSERAQYKIASRWTDGITEELKTYGLACEAHVAEVFRTSLEKQKQCRLVQGESLEVPQILRMEPGQQGVELVRVAEMEDAVVSETG